VRLLLLYHASLCVKLREELSGSGLETQMSDAIDDASFSLQVGKPERTTELKARLDSDLDKARMVSFNLLSSH
jgi:hypothetical protein